MVFVKEKIFDFIENYNIIIYLKKMMEGGGR